MAKLEVVLGVTFRIHMRGNYLCKLMRKHLAKLKGEQATP